MLSGGDIVLFDDPFAELDRKECRPTLVLSGPNQSGETMPGLLFDLFDERAFEGADDYRFQSVEIKQTSFRIDGAFTSPEKNELLPVFFHRSSFSAGKDLLRTLGNLGRTGDGGQHDRGSLYRDNGRNKREPE